MTFDGEWMRRLRRTPADLEQTQAELADVYGPVPDEANVLLELAELRIAAAKWDIRSIIVQMSPNDVPPEDGRPTGDLIFSFRQRGEGVPPLSSSLKGKEQGQDALATKVKRLFANTRGSVRVPDPKTIHLRLPEAYFEPQTLIRFLQKTFAAANK